MPMEKINIYVPEKIGKMLENDAVMFEVYKKDGRTINKNRFLGLLIKGYYGDYISEARAAFETILSSIETKKLSLQEKEQIADSVLKNTILPTVPSRKGKHPARLSLKPTKDTETLIQQILIDLIFDCLNHNRHILLENRKLPRQRAPKIVSSLLDIFIVRLAELARADQFVDRQINIITRLAGQECPDFAKGFLCISFGIRPLQRGLMQFLVSLFEDIILTDVLNLRHGNLIIGLIGYLKAALFTLPEEEIPEKASALFRVNIVGSHIFKLNQL